MKINVGVYKEPRGFIKILELAFSITAFALVCAYDDTLTFRVNCNVPVQTTQQATTTTAPTTTITTAPTTTTATTSLTTERTTSAIQETTVLYTITTNASTSAKDEEQWEEMPVLDPELIEESIRADGPNVTILGVVYKILITYPFRLEDQYQVTCNGTMNVLYLDDNTSAEAIYFVFTGVITFLYVFFMMGVYLFIEEYYAGTKTIAIADFIVTIVLVVMWLAACVAWAAGLTNLKITTSEDDLIESNPQVCHDPYTCSVAEELDFTMLDISVVFGFATLALFVGNIWFLYKETGIRPEDRMSSYA